MQFEIADRPSQVIRSVRQLFPDWDVESVTPLHGGMSAEIFVVSFLNEKRRLTARFPGSYVRDLFDNPAEQEFRTLQCIYAAGIPCPMPIAMGDASDGSFLILEFLEGKPTANPNDPDLFIRECAQTLAQIHKVDISAGQFDFLPETKSLFKPQRTEFNDLLNENQIVQKLANAGPQNVGPTVLRHGDFWPGNILWQDGRISGIIDWENTLRGPAIADLAISRLDIWWILGREAMESFTKQYLEFNKIDTINLAYWDLRISLRPMGNIADWAPPYAALERPDITSEHLTEVLKEFIGNATSRLM